VYVFYCVWTKNNIFVQFKSYHFIKIFLNYIILNYIKVKKIILCQSEYTSELHNLNVFFYEKIRLVYIIQLFFIQRIAYDYVI